MKIASQVLFTEVGNKWIAVPVGYGKETTCGVASLNETGKLIFEALVEGLDEGQVASLLVERYGIDDATAAEAVQSIIEKLDAVGLIEW